MPLELIWDGCYFELTNINNTCIIFHKKKYHRRTSHGKINHIKIADFNLNEYEIASMKSGALLEYGVIKCIATTPIH